MHRVDKSRESLFQNNVENRFSGFQKQFFHQLHQDTELLEFIYLD